MSLKGQYQRDRVGHPSEREEKHTTNEVSTTRTAVQLVARYQACGSLTSSTCVVTSCAEQDVCVFAPNPLETATPWKRKSAYR